MNKVQVNTKGIKHRLRSLKPPHVISEYIWNGFDAGATLVEIKFVADELGTIKELFIIDNGTGIKKDELYKKFIPVLASETKSQEENNTLTHGKNGMGRLSFFQISEKIEFKTVYKKQEDYFCYSIDINSSNLHTFADSEENKSNDEETGTIVEFINISSGLSEDYFNSTIIDFLKKEFCIRLELTKHLRSSIKINDVYLEYQDMISNDREEGVSFTCGDYNFIYNYIRWSKKPNEYSKYYCFDSSYILKHSKPTTFNNKGDEFYHSIYIRSDFFNNFEPVIDESGQASLINKPNNLSHDSFKSLIKRIEIFLENKRNPFLLEYSMRLVDDYDRKGVFPIYEPKNQWEKIKADELKEVVSKLYQVEPKIFVNLNITQKKTFVAFISLLMDSGELGKIFEIMSSIVELTPDERSKLCGQLKLTKLSSIIKTIELISDRYKAVAHFKKLVFNKDMYAGEVPHLQKMMEKNYWLLGEEYQLLSAAERDFEDSLRRFCYKLRGDTEKKKINHIDKNKEMDLLIIRQGKRNSTIENIVIELKHPSNVNLGKKEFDQVYSYLGVIKSEPRFNGKNMKWKFFLIGNKFDTSGYIDGYMNIAKDKGEQGLAMIDPEGHRIYVRTWNEIFTEFELRHDFLDERLKLERDRIIVDENLSASDIINIPFSSDSQVEITIPPAPSNKNIIALSDSSGINI